MKAEDVSIIYADYYTAVLKTVRKTFKNRMYIYGFSCTGNNSFHRKMKMLEYIRLFL